MRTIVTTGAAGCGTTTIADALAHRLAGEGRRTLLLVDGGGVGSGGGKRRDEPTVRAVEPLDWAEAAWQSITAIRRLLGSPWSRMTGMDVLPVPGLAEVAWWAALRRAWSEAWDCIVLDAGPIGPAIQMLTLPDTIVGGLRRTWPLAERAGAAAGTLEAGSWHLRAMARLDSEAAEFASRLRSGGTVIHVVTCPTRHAMTRILEQVATLALFELPLTDIVLNRAVARRKYDEIAQQSLIDALPGTAIRVAHEHRGTPSRSRLGRQLLAEGQHPGSRLPRPRLGREGEHYLWKWHLPFADAAQIRAVADRDDLILSVARSRRVVPLPSVLRRCTLQAVSARQSAVQLSFAPDPNVWPTPRES